MSKSGMPTFDFTPEDREELQCILAEFDGALGPTKRKARAGELVLLRKFWAYVKRYPYLFPPKLQAAREALGKRSALELLSADERAEIEG